MGFPKLRPAKAVDIFFKTGSSSERRLLLVSILQKYVFQYLNYRAHTA